MEEAAGTVTGRHWEQKLRGLTRERSWPGLLLGAVLALALLLVLSRTAPDGFVAKFESLVARDIEQSRIDAALPAPQGDLVFTQSFVPRHDGLSEIELTLVRYGEATASESAHITLELLNDQGEMVAEKSFAASALAHNQVLQLPIATQTSSGGQRYLLRLSGSHDNNVSAWGYSLDTYRDGQLIQEGAQQDPASAPLAQDLRFVTRYRLTWPGALRGISEAIYYEGLLLLVAILMLPLPGVLLLLGEHAYRLRQPAGMAARLAAPWDPAAWWGTALALGVAAWPVLWSWLTLVGAHWTGWLLALVVAGGWIFAIWFWRHERRLRLENGRRPGEAVQPRPPLALPWRWDHLALLAVMLLGLAVRLLAVRDTPLLPWVDASRHGLITAVMAQNGQAISDYTPFLPVDRFPYHFGFHTISSSLLLLTGWPLDRLLLYLGQLLNALVPLGIYAAVWLMIRSRGAGYLAAFLIALPFFFPAYYTTWGRLTQLTAVLMLPVLLAFTWQLIRGSAAWIERWWLLGILAAGLFLIHFRVFVYYLPFPLLVLLVSRARRTRCIVAAATLALILVLPRVFGLIADTNPVQRISRTIAEYNRFPIDYVTTGWEQLFLVIAVVGLVVAIIAALLRQTWAILPLVLAGWVAALFALLSIDRLGLKLPSLVNQNSLYIVVFVPLSIFLALTADQVWRRFHDWPGPVRFVGQLLAGALLAVMLVFGVRQQIGILNPQTLLVQAEDMPGLRWVENNLPADAHIAVNSWRWLGETWAAADGGAWILPLTGRAVTTPPIDYIYNPELFRQVREFNEAASAVSDWSDPAQAGWLRDQGITHVFVGKRGGFFDPAKLARNPQLELLYGRDGVFIFAVAP